MKLTPGKRILIVGISPSDIDDEFKDDNRFIFWERSDVETKTHLPERLEYVLFYEHVPVSLITKVKTWGSTLGLTKMFQNENASSVSGRLRSVLRNGNGNGAAPPPNGKASGAPPAKPTLPLEEFIASNIDKTASVGQEVSRLVKLAERAGYSAIFHDAVRSQVEQARDGNSGLREFVVRNFDFSPKGNNANSAALLALHEKAKRSGFPDLDLGSLIRFVESLRNGAIAELNPPPVPKAPEPPKVAPPPIPIPEPEPVAPKVTPPILADPVAASPKRYETLGALIEENFDLRAKINMPIVNQLIDLAHQSGFPTTTSGSIYGTVSTLRKKRGIEVSGRGEPSSPKPLGPPETAAPSPNGPKPQTLASFIRDNFDFDAERQSGSMHQLLKKAKAAGFDTTLMSVKRTVGLIRRNRRLAAQSPESGNGAHIETTLEVGPNTEIVAGVVDAVMVPSISPTIEDLEQLLGDIGHGFSLLMEGLNRANSMLAEIKEVDRNQRERQSLVESTLTNIREQLAGV
jgi:hypothetical protein